MELRQYWNVVWKRKWLVAAIVGLTALFSAYLFLTGGRTYDADMHFTMRQESSYTQTSNLPFFNFDDYYRWISAEYLVDDYTQLIESDSYGNSVIDAMKEQLAAGKYDTVTSSDGKLKMDTGKLKEQLDKIKPEDIIAYTGADRRHRELRVFVQAPSRDLAIAILDATGIVFTNNRLKPVENRGTITDKPILAQIDEPKLDDIKSSSSRDLTSAIVRVIMGLAGAIALAFLLEYLDNSVRDERDAKRVLDLPVLGAIPRT